MELIRKSVQRGDKFCGRLHSKNIGKLGYSHRVPLGLNRAPVCRSLMQNQRDLTREPSIQAVRKREQRSAKDCLRGVLFRIAIIFLFIERARPLAFQARDKTNQNNQLRVELGNLRNWKRQRKTAKITWRSWSGTWQLFKWNIENKIGTETSWVTLERELCSTNQYWHSCERVSLWSPKSLSQLIRDFVRKNPLHQNKRLRSNILQIDRSSRK